MHLSVAVLGARHRPSRTARLVRCTHTEDETNTWSRESVMRGRTKSHSGPHARRRLRLIAAVTAGLLAVLSAPVTSVQAAEATVPFSITIRHISCGAPDFGNCLEGAFDGPPDFYVKAWINGVKVGDGDPDAPSSPIIDDDYSIDPFWTLPAQVPESVTTVPVTIQVWDEDSFDDDLADISPIDGHNNLDFQVDRRTGRWSARGFNWPQNCVTGDGGDDDEHAAKICIDIGGDSDGDGLLDAWERNGYDDNGDGTVDVDLPAMGANPHRKDLFLEIDEIAHTSNWHLSRAGIVAMKAAFAAAPGNTGTRAGEREGFSGENEGTHGVSAPPTSGGVAVHVDAGGLVDPRAREGARPNCTDGVDNDGDGWSDALDPNCNLLEADDEAGRPGNCNDLDNSGSARDNDGDGLANGQDPDCLVGDPVFAGPLGRGRTINTGACGVDDPRFYTAKNGPGGQDHARRYLFRYMIVGPAPAVSTCPLGKDGKPKDPAGGQAEGGGNDLIVFNEDGGTVMHELGHTLNLHHGGGEDHNCKPNYVSVMSYTSQFGIRRQHGGRIFDYSPVRRNLSDSGNRSRAPLPTLDERHLDETQLLDAADDSNRTVHSGPGGESQLDLDSRPNWNQDTDPPNETDVAVDLDLGPDACTKHNKELTAYAGAEDWPFVSLSFHGFGDAADAAVAPLDDRPLTTAELRALERSLTTTDLVVSVTDSPDPVAAGNDLTYTVTVANRGANPADTVEVVSELPAEVRFKHASAPCDLADTTLTCALGQIAAGATRTFTAVANVPADAVHRNGGPLTLTHKSTATNLRGHEETPDDNTATSTTKVVAMADLRVTGAEPTSPLEVLIGGPSSATLAVTVDNLGPSTPADGVLSTTATATSGVTVTPKTSTVPQDALVAGKSRSTTLTVELECTAPGVQQVDLTTRIALADPDDVDPDLTNNSRTASFKIDCVVPIAINVRPGGHPNSVNLNTDATVAALTTTAGEYGLPLAFDATAIDVDATRWGLRERLFDVATPTGAREIHRKGHREDSYELDEVTMDGDTDMTLHFKPDESGLSEGSTEACLKGRYHAPGGQTWTFLGCDSVRVVN